ncbi:MAG TPA: carboxypeptidase-like regulatory domain-containing protein [Pyrinomonadaceae bacterium]|nr:carboxypeptidase-like regulatory domain-containing protein [Pyrinomonadaceae bacterium]
MKKFSSISAALFFVFAFIGPADIAYGGKGSLATVTGSVRDHKGNPLAGAVVSLIKEGATRISKTTKTGPDGSFAAKISPGRYGIRAIAQGFNEVVFDAVEVRASQELIYKFNLEPAGSGNTLPETRRDRDDVKWRLRAAQAQRSIFQIQEADDETINAIIAAESANSPQPQADSEVAIRDTEDSESNKGTRPQGVIESYFGSGADGGFTGLNFAFAVPASDHVELIFAGQTGTSLGANNAGAPQRFEVKSLIRAGDHHRLNVGVGAANLNSSLAMSRKKLPVEDLGQFSVRAIDEWVVRDGVVIVLGLDYSRFIGASSAQSMTPRFGVQFDANARTRLKAAYAPGGDEITIQDVVGFEGVQVAFQSSNSQPVAFVDGEAVMARSRRFEIGVERILDNESSVEATAFFDTTSGRGVGLLSMPMSGFSGAVGEKLSTVANQEGSARGVRVVYTRRLNSVWTASAGYSFGRGQRLSSQGLVNPADIFQNGFFQTAALQLGAGLGRGTRVRTVFRFSREATVFAIDPFAGRLGVYDPSLSIQVTRDLPTFGLPLHAEAIIDARNLLDVQSSSENGEVLTLVSTTRRSVRGGISVRF